MKNWIRDYLSYMHPDICEVVYDHAHDCTITQFKDRWAPDLTDLKDKILIITEVPHYKYGHILKEHILLSRHDYELLNKSNYYFEFFDGELEISFRQLVKKMVTEPYVIFIYQKGIYANNDSILHNAIQSALNRLKNISS